MCTTCVDMQNPEVVALKEDIKRTGKKLKLWERELEDRKTKLADQHSKVAKLEQDLEQVNAGEHLVLLLLHVRQTYNLAYTYSCHVNAHNLCVTGNCMGRFHPDNIT